MVSTKFPTSTIPLSKKQLLESCNNEKNFSGVKSLKDLNSSVVVEDDQFRNSEYLRAIQDLNSLQSNTQVIGLAKYKNPETILPLFRRQMHLAGVSINRLNRLSVLHVSGTKGKGSTCAFAESILRHAGLKTGFYNSPHLVKVTERIQLDGSPIDEQLFAKYFREVFDRLVVATRDDGTTMPSYFSFLTILAFHIFIEEQVDCAVVEVGMGGEYDPTNVIERPVACGITTLDIDHTSVLGSTIESIAWNKAGIMKTGAPLFTINHVQSQALKVIEERAREKQVQVHVCPPIRSTELNLGIQSSAQYFNAALACQLANCLLARRSNVRPSSTTELKLAELPIYFRRGLEKCQWPGRCQIIEFGKRMCFFVDGAHTRKSMENCLEWFDYSSSSRKDGDICRVLMVNVIGDRDKREVLRPLSKYDKFDCVIFSTNRINSSGDTAKSETFVNVQGPSCEKSLDNARNNVHIWQDLRGNVEDDVIISANTQDALVRVEQLATLKFCHVLATGSLHFVGAVLETMSELNKREYHRSKVTQG